MKLKSATLAVALVAISAGSAMAGFTTAVQNNVLSNGPRGVGAGVIGTGNGSFVHNHAGPNFTPGSITVVGSLTEVDVGTWGSEARFEVCNPTTCVVTAAHIATGNFTGTLAINNTQTLPAGLTGSSVGNWTFEAFESYNDPGNPDARWDNLTITIGDATPPPPAFSGNFTGTPNSLTNNNKALGTTIWDFNNPQPGLTDGAGELALGTRYTGSTFDQVGNEVGYKVIHPGGNLIGDLTGLTTDIDLLLLDASGVPTTGTLARSENGGTTAEHVEILGAAAGTYYLVVDTFGTGNNGSPFSITYTPEPATLTLLAFGAIGLIRRRR